MDSVAYIQKFESKPGASASSSAAISSGPEIQAHPMYVTILFIAFSSSIS